jgi:hypothetical protein
MQFRGKWRGLGELFYKAPFHTFLFAAHPVVALLAANIDQVFAEEAFIPLLVSISVAGLLLVGLRVLTKDWQLAGLLTSLFSFWFFVYGRLFVPLIAVDVFGVVIGRHRYVLAAWSALFVAPAIWLLKRKPHTGRLTLGLNIFSALLVLLATIPIAAFSVRNLSLGERVRSNTEVLSISWRSDSRPPDIYYIVLDEYARPDVLKAEFGIDVTDFLDGLRGMGFYVAECAQSNYMRTAHSLASTLNMTYIQDLVPKVPPDQDPSVLLPFLIHNVARQQLEALGYKTVVFKNPWERFLWDDADIVFRSGGAGALSPFEFLLLRTTVVRVYLDLHLTEARQMGDYVNYVDTLYALRKLPEVPPIPGPKFVFVHLVIPHPPFVFGPDGERIHIPYDADAGNIYTEGDYKRGYAAAVSYINKRMLEILPRLIASSDPAPIIILAGDHGTPWGGSQNAVKILAAFYTPGSSSPFYQTVTLVNVFRILFDTYFNGRFGLLPDKSYLFTEKGRFDFVEVPVECGVPSP